MRYLTLLVFTCLISTNAHGQEAFIGQIGQQNTSVNGDLSQSSQLAAFQQGNRNSALQLSGGGSNAIGAVQIGNRNAIVSVTQGRRNLIGTAQLGSRNTSSVGVQGNRNTVGTLQAGNRNSSAVGLQANDASVSVTQFGRNRQSNLAVVDEAATRAARGLSRGGGLQVLVNQGPRSQPVNATVARDATGNVTIRPGTATTVIQLR